MSLEQMKKEFWLKNAHHSKSSTSDIYSRTREKKRMHSAEKVTGTTFGIALHRKTSYWNYFCFNHSDMNWKEGERNRPKETLFFFAIIFRSTVVFVFLVRAFFHATIHLQFYSNSHLICRSHTIEPSSLLTNSIELQVINACKM